MGAAARFVSVALLFAAAAELSNEGSAETGTAEPAALGRPNIERIIASAICAGDAAIDQGFAVVFAAGDFKPASGATCGAV